MTTMTTERPPARRRADIERPESGIDIDPERLIWYRSRLALSRQEVSDAITRRWLDKRKDALPFRHRSGPPADGHRVQPGLGLASRTCQVCGGRVTGGLTRDAIAKIENGERKPKPRNVRALCIALSTPGRLVTPEDLLPGGPELIPDPEAEAEARRERRDRNKAMIAFADSIGREDLYRNPVSRRISYKPELYRLFAAHEAAEEPEQAALAG